VPASGDIVVSAALDIYSLDSLVAQLHPIYYIRNQYENEIEDTLSAMGLHARFAKVIPEENAAEIQVKQTSKKEDYITLKALVFPYINVLWLGVIVMVIGFFISLWNRGATKEKMTEN